MQEEIWKPVLGLVGFYEVSNLGRVKSLKRQCKTSTAAGYRTVPEKILKPVLWGPYWSVQLCLFGVVRRRRIHELVLTAFVGPCPRGMWCRHLDGNRDNNMLPNLKWGTHLENEADKQAHGTTARGARNGNSKLTDDQVRAILRSTKSQKETAREFGVSLPIIVGIWNGSKWAHISAETPRLVYDRRKTGRGNDFRGNGYIASDGTRIRNALQNQVHLRGDLNGHSKLTEDQVREIIRSGRSDQDIARQFGISRANASMIRRRITWKHITDI